MSQTFEDLLTPYKKKQIQTYKSKTKITTDKTPRYSETTNGSYDSPPISKFQPLQDQEASSRKINYTTVRRNKQKNISQLKLYAQQQKRNRNSIPKNSFQNYQNKEKWIAEELIKKIKATPESSFLGLLMQSRKEQNHEKVTCSLETQRYAPLQIKVPVHSILTQKHNQLKISGLKFLEAKINEEIKLIIHKFRRNAINIKFYKRLIRKFHLVTLRNKRLFFNKFVFYSRDEHNQILSTKRRVVRDLLNKALQRRDRLVIDSLLRNHQDTNNKKISTIKYLFMRVENNLIQSFLIWSYKVHSLKYKNQNKQKMENKFKSKNLCLTSQTLIPISYFMESQTKKIQHILTSQQQKNDQNYKILFQILNKIGLVQPFKNLKRNAHLHKTIQKCSAKLACGPKLNIQRALWRMKINAFHEN